MSGKKKTQQSSTTTNTVSPYTRTLINEGRSNVRGMMNDNPYQAYGGERVAGLSGLEQQAMDQFSQNQGQGVGLMQQAAQQAQMAGGYRPEQIQAQSFADADLSAYMNPHLEAVRDANAQQIGRERDMRLAEQQDQAIAQGAFGGSRSGVAQAETERAYGDIQARMDAQLRSDAFNSAANLFGQDANRQLTADTTNANLGLQGAQLGLQGAGLMGQLGGQIDDSNRANAGALAQFGGLQRGIEQAGLDADYQEFLRQDEDTQRRIQNELALMGLTPVVTNSSSTGQSTTRSSPGLGQLVGLGLQGASLFSERELKDNIVHIGEARGLPLYRYNYVWDEKTTHEGHMADDVEATYPEAVTVDGPTGWRKVNYAMLEAA